MVPPDGRGRNLLRRRIQWRPRYSRSPNFSENARLTFKNLFVILIIHLIFLCFIKSRTVIKWTGKEENGNQSGVAGGGGSSGKRRKVRETEAKETGKTWKITGTRIAGNYALFMHQNGDQNYDQKFNLLTQPELCTFLSSSRYFSISCPRWVITENPRKLMRADVI